MAHVGAKWGANIVLYFIDSDGICANYLRWRQHPALTVQNNISYRLEEESLDYIRGKSDKQFSSLVFAYFVAWQIEQKSDPRVNINI
jgi:hypothetical protein